MTANLRASLLMAASMSGFTLNDALVKSLSDEINAGQVMVVRGLIMIAFLSAYIRLARVPMPLRSVGSPLIALRVTGELLATVFFLTALFNMPLANVTAILQALPLVVTLGAALFLGEPVGIRRFVAILIGFAGVLIVLRPGLEGFSVYGLLVVLAVICAATRDLATRRLPGRIPSLLVTMLTTVAVTLFGMLLVQPLGGWAPMNWDILWRLAAASACLFVGYQCVVLAMRDGDIHVVAPFRYTSLLWAILLGVLFFGEFPDGLTMMGASIIVATGIYTLYRERVVSRGAADAARSATTPPSTHGT